MSREKTRSPEGEYPRHMLNMLGKNALETFDLAADIAEEYEALILEDNLSLTLIFETMQVEGVLDDLVEAMEDIREEISENMAKYVKRKERAGFDTDKIYRGARAALNEYFQTYAIAETRPILRALVVSLFQKIAIAGGLDYLSHYQRGASNWRYGTEKEMYLGAMANASSPEEKSDIENQIGIFCLGRRLQMENRVVSAEAEEEMAFARLQIDEILEGFRYKRYEGEATRCTLPESWEYAHTYTELDLQPCDNTSLICGARLNLKLGNGEEKIGVIFYLSRLSGELTTNDGLTSIKMILDHYGQGYMYEMLRVHTIQHFQNLLNHAEFGAAIKVRPSDLITEVNTEITRVTDPPVEELPDIEEEPLPTQEKKAHIGTIDHRTAVRAFERLGFTYDHGGRGRHPKIRRGRQVLPFPHPHKRGTSGDISYLVKWVLKKAGVSRREFLDAIK